MTWRSQAVTQANGRRALAMARPFLGSSWRGIRRSLRTAEIGAEVVWLSCDPVAARRGEPVEAGAPKKGSEADDDGLGRDAYHARVVLTCSGCLAAAGLRPRLCV